MDGNRRWAAAKGLTVAEGYHAGADALRAVVRAAPSLGVGVLSLYAFSSGNWGRPPEEVALLMHLFERHLRSERDRLVAERVRVDVIGRRDRLASGLLAAVEEMEQATADGERLLLRIAVDYSSRHAILSAAADAEARRDPDRFERAIARAAHASVPAPPLDLVVRTSGEQRLSDFMLWEAAWAELLFWGGFWPDFREAELGLAVAAYRRRDRRFGATAAPRGSLGVG